MKDLVRISQKEYHNSSKKKLRYFESVKFLLEENTYKLPANRQYMSETSLNSHIIRPPLNKKSCSLLRSKLMLPNSYTLSALADRFK